MNASLFNAASNGDFGFVRSLVETGNYDSETLSDAVVYAAEKGYLNIVDYLYNNGGQSPGSLRHALTRAAIYNHLDVVRYLMDHGVPNIERGMTNINIVLTGAAGHGHLGIVQYALDHGATDIGKALALAAEGNKLNTAQYLVQRIGDRIPDDALWNASHAAERHGSTNVYNYIESVIRSRNNQRSPFGKQYPIFRHY